MDEVRGRRGRWASLGLVALGGAILTAAAVVPAGAAGLLPLPPVTTPTTPPVTVPEVPVTTPPVTTPPVTLPPVPVTTPPVTTPPVTTPPVTLPPVPVTAPPVTVPVVPVTAPPVSTPALPVPLPDVPPVVPGAAGSALGRQLTVWPSSGTPGTVVDLIGVGFDTGRRVKVTYMVTARYKVKLCAVKVRPDGQLRCRVSIPMPPRSGAPGAHAIVAKVLPNDGTPTATATFTLQQ